MGRNVVTVFVSVFIICTIACFATGSDIRDPSHIFAGGSLKMTDLTRQELTKRAAGLGQPIAAALERPETVVERMVTPFFLAGEIYRVSTRPPERPRQWILGAWGKEGIKVLNNDPEAFFELAANSDLKLTSSADYVAYVTTFIESTRDFMGGPQILKRIEDSWWLQKPTPEEVRHQQEVIAKYSKVVEAPALSRDANATVIIYLIRDRALLLMRAKVENSGHINVTETVLEPEMPTVMLR